MRIETNGTTLNCRIEGREGAPWILFSHGIATSLAIYDEVSRLLSNKYRVLTYDSRGHGGSEAPGGGYTLEMLGDDAVGLMDKLGIDKAHYGGLSLGGMTAIGMAINHPERLHSAICLDARADAPPDFVSGWKQRIEAVREKDMEALVEGTLQRWFTPEALQNKAMADRMRDLIRKTPPEGFIGSATALQGLNFASRLGSIKVPMLYLVGAQDQGAPPATMRQMAEQTPGAQFVEIPNAGHISTVEQPQAVAQAIDTFISGLGSRRAA